MARKKGISCADRICSRFYRRPTFIHVKDALKNSGCEEIFHDIASGAKAARPGLRNALSHLHAGDMLVVWKLDRLGRSLAHLIQTVKELNERDFGFKFLQENIDTTSGGQLIFHIFGALYSG